MTTSFGPQLTVDDPVELIVCQTIIIVWSNGLPPYFITVHNDQTPDNSPLTISNGESSTSVAWTVKFPPGATVVFHLMDSTGATARTSPVIVQRGGDISCLSTVTQSNSTVNTSPPGIDAFPTGVSETAPMTDLPVLNVSSAGSTTSRSEVDSTSIPRDSSVTSSGSRTSDTASGIPIKTWKYMNTPTESAHPTNAAPGYVNFESYSGALAEH
ncbi:hypothetical protein V5O48_007340 [Marasmius crinis-equi]|uniref:Fibronectin type-III domain-containing protein n=1 Tax=Marasmius crinis-equi TaxID=585013 RepID=A0ABR3FGX9_9AGAR